MFQNIPPGLKNLLIVLAICTLAQYILPSRLHVNMEQFYLSYFSSPDFRPWQLVTHIFLHGGITHLIFNALALFSFGAIMEAKLGTKKFLILFFASAFGAVFVQYVSQAIELAYHFNGRFYFDQATGMQVKKVMEEVMNQPAGAGQVYVTAAQQPYYELGKVLFSKMLGASGALYGVLIGFLYYYPNQELMFLFIPYPIKAKYLIPIILLLDIVGAFGQFSWDPVAHFAHIGGAITGYLLLRYWGWQRLKQKWQ